jgi:O-antigen/teichoic acid export membrane protein
VRAGLALVAEEFVPVVLGEQWRPATGIIRIFCVLGAGESISITVGWIYQATGRTDVLLRWAIAIGGVPLLGIVAGSLIGTIEAVTIAYAVCTALLLYPAFRRAGRLIGMRVGEVVRAVTGSAICTAGMAMAVVAVGLVVPAAWPDVASLAVKSVVGAIAYAGAVHLARVRAYVDLRDTIGGQRRGHRPEVAG